MNAQQYKNVMAIVDSVIDAQPADRKMVLSDLCGGDTELRVEVELLLKHNTGAGSFMEDSPQVGLDGPPAGSIIGQTIGNYRVTEEIGRGGMGAVYLAERCDGAFDHQVAIKLIKRGMDSDALVRRFLNERRILATLEHPNIARLIDGGTTDDGLPYFIMEFVDGEPIDAYAGRHQLTIEDRLTLFAHVCDAVEYAHARRVMHRDIKPSNILISGEGRPKLLDFGIAKLVEAEAAGDRTVTETAWRLLTPAYASPEQVRGGQVTPRTDVYSLGVLLFELLTGRGPYEFPSRSPLEMAQTICEQEPDLPSSVVGQKTSETDSRSATGGGSSIAAAGLRKRLRGDLDRIVVTALQKEPERRYQSAAEFAADVRRHLEGHRVQAGGFTWKDKLSRYFKKAVVRRWRPAYTLLALLIIATVSFISALWLSGRNTVVTPKFDTIAVLPFKYEGEGDPYIGPGIAEALIGRLGRTRQFDVRPLRAVMTYASGEARDLKLIGETLQVDAVLDGTIQKTGDDLDIAVTFYDSRSDTVLWNYQLKESQQNVAGLQDSLYREISRRLAISQDSVRTTRTRNAAAYEAFLKGRFQWNKRTTEGYESAISLFQQAISLDAEFVEAYAGSADAYALLACVMEQIDKRPERMALARQFAEKAIALDPTLAQPYATLGFMGWHYEWNWTASDEAFKRAIELDPSYATAHHWYSFLLVRMNRMDEAVAEIRRAQALDPLSQIIATDVGEILYWAGRYSEALDAAQRATEMSGEGGEQWYVPSVYRHMGDHDRALAAVQRSVDRSKRSPAELEILAEAYFRLGKLDMARRALTEAKRKGGSPGTNDPVKYFAREEEMKRVLAYLKFEYGFRGAGITMVHNHPMYARLRSDPRVQEYIRLARLSEYALPPSE
ncbi:MAG: protein kinase [Pyrinomonadaceae bacterium]